MPNIFVNLDQSVVVKPSKIDLADIEEAYAHGAPNFEVNFKFLKKGSDSSCGFVMTNDCFESGGFKLEKAQGDGAFTLSLCGLAKVKIYEMQVNALESGDPLVIESVSLKGTYSAMLVGPIAGSADQTIKFDGASLVQVKGKIGLKKTDVK